MDLTDIEIISLTHQSPEFDAAYDVIGQDIAPEYLETRQFLRNRLRVRDEGAKTEKEKLLVPAGYTLHLLAAVQADTVIGAIYGHLISGITGENRSVCFVTYLSVHRDHRRRGIGTCLIGSLQRRVDRDAVRTTGIPIFGMVYEIEKEGKDAIKAAVSRLGARPLDVEYLQPALRRGYGPERMDLWFQPVPPLTREQRATFTLKTDFVTDMVCNMLMMEYVGPDMKGCDRNSCVYTVFLDSVGKREEIGSRT